MALLSSEEMDKVHTNTVRRLTVKQILGAKSSSDKSTVFFIDDASVHYVLCTGWIYNVKKDINATRLLFYDGTGEIECIIWNNQTGYIPSFIYDINGSACVNVLGSFSSYNQKISLICMNISLVIDGNQIIYHALECIRQHKGDSRAEKSMQHTEEESFLREEENSSYWTGPNNSLSRVHIDIIKFFQDNQRDTGLSRKVVRHTLSICNEQKYTLKEVDDAIEFLLKTGKLYSASTDDDELVLLENDTV